MTGILDPEPDIVPDPTASEVHPRLGQRALVPGSLNGLDEPGPPGQDGAPGQGVPPGGTAGQVLVKVDDDDYDTEWVDAETGDGGGGGSQVVAGPPITGATTVAPNTFYPINLAANLGNIALTMPTAPPQGTVVQFTRQDSNIFTSTPRVTPGFGDNIGDTGPYVITVRNVLVSFTYWGTTWWPAVPVGGASGLSGATPSSAFAPTIMSRDNFGRSQIEDPVAPKDIVNLEYLQAHGGSGGGSDEVAIRPDDPTTPEPTAELWVDTDDATSGFLVPTTITDWNLAIPGGYYTAGGSTPNAPSTSTYAGITYTDGQAGHYTQVVYRIASTSTSVEQWQRQMIGGTSWTPWKRIDLNSPQAPASTTDLNTALAPGFYWAPTTALNTPIASRAYHVWTYAAGDTPTNVVQVAYRATAGVTIASSEFWQRTGSGGNWSPWVDTQQHIYSAVVAVTINGVSSASKAITFPVGMFAATPVVNMTAGGGTSWGAGASFTDNTGTTVNVRSYTGGNGGTTPLNVFVTAMDAS